MHICTTAPILFKQTMNQLTSSAANFKTAVNGVLSGTLNLKYNHANESLCNNWGKKKKKPCVESVTIENGLSRNKAQQ